MSPYVASLRQKIGNMRIMLPSVSAIIYGPSGRILMIRQRDGDAWSTPGGAIDPDETPLDAVVREVWEETGLTVEPVGLIGMFGGPNFVIRYENGDETQYVMAVYECAIRSGEIIQSSDEVTACRYISQDSFETLRVSPWTREVLPLCYARVRSPIVGPVSWTPPATASQP
jgi:8-oxo-dGTP pyrophosphatase MutT (NUDIX family)